MPAPDMDAGLCLRKARKDVPKAWVPATDVVEYNEVPGFCLSQQLEDLSFQEIIFKQASKQVNKKTNQLKASH